MLVREPNMRICAILVGFLAFSFAALADSRESEAGTFPLCEERKVINKIARRFNQTEKIYWQYRGHRLEEILNAHLHSENPFPDSPINRRYCHADAVFADGKSRRIHYLIEEGAGFAGFTWNVTYCVHGLDPWKYFDGRCRVLSR